MGSKYGTLPIKQLRDHLHKREHEAFLSAFKTPSLLALASGDSLPSGITVAEDRPSEGAPNFVPTIAFVDTNLDQRPPRGPYRRHAIEFKRAVVEQSLQPGASVSRIARQHDVNANQIFAWRKAYWDRRLGVAAFVPIIFTGTEGLDATEMLEAPADAFGRLTIECKGARLTVEGRPDAQMLAHVLAVLLR
ncbi:transposase [Thauera sp.]|uniref:IS66-like element accessory protein TnpA n=1 Tax=Thauera sp. TaxID=1905334 RepID=UPI002579FB18|nr:transposase [Thauera sp.]